MRVLLLSNNWEVAAPVRRFLQEREKLSTSDQNINRVEYPPVDIIVSYCYRYILGESVLRTPAVNLHNSLLPWGRGAQPLFWSVVNDEPCGVSIHWMDAGLDTGEVIDQHEIVFPEDMTFREAYAAQHGLLARLFIKDWDYIRNKAGTEHTVREFEAVRGVLGPEGWDCTIGDAKRRGDEVYLRTTREGRVEAAAEKEHQAILGRTDYHEAYQGRARERAF